MIIGTKSGANLLREQRRRQHVGIRSLTAPYVRAARAPSATIQPHVDGRWMTQFGSKTFVDATWLKAAISVQAIARGLIVRAQAKHKDTNRFSVTYGDYAAQREKKVRS